MSFGGTRTSPFRPVPSLNRANTWTAKQTFPAGIKLGIGARLEFDDDEDTYMLAPVDDQMGFVVGSIQNWFMATAGLRLDSSLFSVVDDIPDLDLTPSVFGRFIMKEDYSAPRTITDLDSPIDGQSITIIFLSGNVTIAHGTNIHLLGGKNTLFPPNTSARFVYSSDTGDWYQVSGYYDSVQGVFYLPEIPGAPAALANYGEIYSRDIAGVAEVHVQDDVPNETQISPHELKKWVYRSQNILAKKKIQIDMEKFMLEKFPQYVKINDIQQSKIPGNIPNGKLPIFTTIKPKWYQIIKKWRCKHGRR